MFKTFTFIFEKFWTEDNQIITDNSLMKTILDSAKENNVEIRKIHLSNLYTCFVRVKGKRKDYLDFVYAILSKSGNYLTKIKI